MAVLNLKKKGILVFLFFVVSMGGVLAQAGDLSIDEGDIVLETRTDGENFAGYDLYIRQRGNIQSVLPVVSFESADGGKAKVGLRATEYNNVNGDEIRKRNGEPITFEDKSFSITSSTPQPHTVLGSAFHLYLPPTAVYGNNSTPNTLRINEDTVLTLLIYSEKYNEGTYADKVIHLGELVPAQPPKESVVSFTPSPSSRVSLEALKEQLKENGIVTEERLKTLYGDDDNKLQKSLTEYFKSATADVE